MGSVAEERAALIKAPVAAADATGATGVFRVAISGASQNAALPSAWVQRGFVCLYCTADVQYAFGIGAAPTLVLNQASAVGTGHVSAGKTLPAGQDKDVPIPVGATHIAWIGSSGYIELYNSQAIG